MLRSPALRLATILVAAALLQSCAGPTPPSAAPPLPGALRVLPQAPAAPAPAGAPRALEGTAWTLASVPDSGLPAQPLATLRFEAGRASGTDGCNRCTASISSEAEGTGIRIGAPAAARMACEQPTGPMAQEAAFLAALPTAATRAREGDRLELRSAYGAPLDTARLAAP